MRRDTTLLITCEHGGNEVPPEVAQHFAGLEDLLASHRGWDIGALGVARQMSGDLEVPFLYSTVTRLLVDLNRSPDAPDVLGPSIRALGAPARQRLLDQFHTPHRQQVFDTVAAAIDGGRRVLHVGVHSFTDVLDDVPREVDLALLFDPARLFESKVADAWIDLLRRARPHWRHRFNEPYHGTDDGLTTWLRTCFADEAYAGIEVEIRQGLIREASAQEDVGTLLAMTLRPLLQAQQT